MTQWFSDSQLENFEPCAETCVGIDSRSRLASANKYHTARAVEYVRAGIA